MSHDPHNAKHSHWSAYDENLEMLEMNRLHIILARGELISDADYDRLVRLARSAGYGEADSFLTDYGLEAQEGESPQVVAQREIFDNYMENDYHSQIDRSLILLQEARPDGATRKAADRICSAMRDAYEFGRNQRIGNEATPSVPKF
jgi:hypothetical protein